MADKFEWTYEDFCAFYTSLTLPSGKPIVLEGFQRLILRCLFSGYVEALVLLPKGSGKTCLMAAVMVYHLLVVRNANVFVGAATKVQAGEIYRFACHFVESEPELNALVRTVKSTKEMFSRRDQGFMRVLASDDSKLGSKAQGYNPSLAILDELHAHENDNLYTDLRSGAFKAHGMVVVITTAGWDLESVLGKLRLKFLESDQLGGVVSDSLVVDDDGFTTRDVERGRLTIAYAKNTPPLDGREFHEVGTERRGSAMLEWALRGERHPLGEDDPDDMAVVKMVNPASWVTVASLQDSLDAPGITPWQFRRWRANLWTLAFDSWLPASAWLSLKHPDIPVLTSRSWLGATSAELAEHVASLFPRGTRIVGAVDMARFRDCAAIVFIGAGPERDGKPTRLVRAIIWRSGGQDNPIPYEAVESVIELAHELYDLAAFAYDEKYFDKSATDLRRAGVRMEKAPQTNERMCPAAADLRQVIVQERKLSHDGDAILSAHVMAAVTADVGDGAFKLVKSKNSGPPIDGCIALAMANVLDSIPPAPKFWAAID